MAMRDKEKEMEWWVSMPKIELHAHLNGSIRDSTLLELARGLGEKGSIDFNQIEDAILKNDRSLAEVFKLFDLIRMVTTDHKTISRITKEVIEDFAADNVIYLELRSTPKRNDTIGMSKRSYMEAVLEGIRAVSAVEVDLGPSSLGQENYGAISNLCDGIKKKKMHVRLLPSIERSETTAAAMETVELALDMRNQGVAGIDLSGNPAIGEWETFLPALKYAREQGLRISLHCGEVPNSKEIHAMLDFHPERIGHACYFEEEEWKKLKSSKIPVEICLTSNIRTESISSLDVHHFADLFKAQHPITLCTDDFGVFSTTLSYEYVLASATFGLGKRELFQLARKAVKFIFAGDEVKDELGEVFDSSAPKLGLS